MKKLVFLLLLVLAAPVWGEVSVISVTDEDKHSSKEDFNHTFEYYVIPSGKPSKRQGKCQATRIGRRWFATAAHCVKDVCEKNGCTIRMDLLDQPVSAFAETVHTPKRPAVFVHPDFSPTKIVQNDFALIRLDLERAPLTYYRRAANDSAPNIGLTPDQFNAYLDANRKANSQYRRLLSPEFPPIVLFDEGNYHIDRKLSVISIFNGVRDIKPDPYPVHYVRELGFAYTGNFGIIKGMSGSGVMTNTGELIGIISANLTAVASAPAQNTKQAGAKQEEFFMFPVFNQSLASFMESTMGSDYYKLDFKDAYPSFVNKSRTNYKAVVEAVNWVNKYNTVTQ